MTMGLGICTSTLEKVYGNTCNSEDSRYIITKNHFKKVNR